MSHPSPNTLGKRYALDGANLPIVSLFPSEHEYCLSPGRKSEHGIIIVAMVAVCIGFVLQFVAGLVCLRALWISKRISKSSLSKYLIFHTLALATTNLAGLVTAGFSFQWMFGPMNILNNDLWMKRACSYGNNEAMQHFVEDHIFWEAERLYAGSWKLALTSDVAFGMSGLLTDAILIWRCRQIWKFTLFSRPNLIVMVPAFLFAGSVVSLGWSCLANLRGYAPTEIYFTTTLTLNIILTSLIISRLWRCKAQLRKVFGYGHGDHYSVLSIVFAESALMNAVCSILLLASSICESRSMSSTMGLMLDVWIAITPAVQACSNYLIIYRGARGWFGSWSNDVTITDTSTIDFRTATSHTIIHDNIMVEV